MKKKKSKKPYTVVCSCSCMPIVRETMIEAMEAASIVDIGRGEGTFRVSEACDGVHTAYLTKAQLLAWADELKAFAHRKKSKP